VDDKTVAWQNSMLRNFNANSYRQHHVDQWRRAYGDIDFPPLCPVPHHRVHAFQAAMQSPFDRSVVLTVDGSGDQHCSVLWSHEGTDLRPIREIFMPHSLGWVYAAFTEYLGFDAYDGEYKVMGLAAYGRPNEDLARKLDQVIFPAEDGVEYRIEPKLIHYGPRTYSERFTDHLVDLLGRKPRLRDAEITSWHEDVAYAVQAKLEETVVRLIRWAVRETGYRNVCIGGGVGLNVKMNSRIFQMPEVEDVFPQPLCSDGGAAAGAALAACFEYTGTRPQKLESLSLGHQETDESIKRALETARLRYDRPEDLCAATAEELAKGHVVGWFQGPMEGGPRALGQRSILADPRRKEIRDKVNAVIKFREYWRPFCPSMPFEAASLYFDEYTDSPFMIIAFEANDRLRQDAPAIVHVDGSSRVQFVKKDVLPRYHRLLTEFGRLTGVPVLLNTSFNVKGEPIVCTIHDALRTFWSTGLEVLVAGDYIVRKPVLQDAT
jgi:carbamoyltransferase